MAQAPEDKRGKGASRGRPLRRKTPLRNKTPLQRKTPPKRMEAPQRKTSPKRATAQRKPQRNSSLAQGRPLRRKFKPRGVAVPAHQDQRDEIALKRTTADGRRTLRCLVCGEPATNPTHIVPRHCGGCNHPLCTEALCNDCHDAYDGRASKTRGRKERINLLESVLLARYRNRKNLTDPPTDPDKFERMLTARFKPRFQHALKHVKFRDLRVALMEGSHTLPVTDRSHWSHPDNAGRGKRYASASGDKRAQPPAGSAKATDKPRKKGKRK